MKRMTLALVSDCIFFMLCTFLTALAVIRFYVREGALAISLAVMTALASGILCLLFMLRRREKLLESLAGKKALERLAIYLATTDCESAAKLVADALNGTYAGGNCILTDRGHAYVLFRAEPLNADAIADILKDEEHIFCALYCNGCTPAAERLASRFGIEIVAAAKVYTILKSAGKLPQCDIPEEKKNSLFKKIKGRFTRKLCPALFFSGLALLTFSMFTFYPVYYVVSGSVLMLLSAISLLVGQSS